MIAKIHFWDTYVELGDDGIWTSPKKVYADLCNSVYSADRIPPSVAAGVSPFAGQARMAHGVMGGQIEWAPAPESVPGTVY